MTKRFLIIFIFITAVCLKAVSQKFDHGQYRIDITTFGWTDDVGPLFSLKNYTLLHFKRIRNEVPNRERKFDTTQYLLKKTDMETIIQILKSIDSLKPIYTNRCVSSGLQFEFTFVLNDKKSSTFISNYYHNKIFEVVKVINKNVLKQHRLVYNKKLLEGFAKDCGI
jgi:hypothetical protein